MQMQQSSITSLELLLEEAVGAGAIQRKSTLEETHLEWLKFAHMGLVRGFIYAWACCFEDDAHHICSVVVSDRSEELLYERRGFNMVSENDMYMLIARYLAESYEDGTYNSHLEHLVDEVDLGLDW